jgi:hypothetical protein
MIVFLPWSSYTNWGGQGSSRTVEAWSSSSSISSSGGSSSSSSSNSSYTN